ncbi:organic cation transporter protein-like isoform X2 [Leptinotarsa decemlineata]|uniref:organic cation transporter protein-like isoform X2 n=1 Tax=Leptinotarsa decemlineata TaxID=7539 RepID=UPI003D30A8D9
MRRCSVDLDDVLEELGELGTFQILTYVLISLPVLFCAAGGMSYVFTAGVPEYRCFIPECEDQLDTSYNVPWMKWAIPNKISEDQVIGVKTDSCSRYVHENDSSEFHSTVCTEKSFTNTTVACSELIFDENERTIVNDFNITCLENQWKISLVGTAHFAGILVGSLVSGILADRFGRKLIFIFCIFLMSVTGTLQVLSPNYMTFVLFMFITSVGTAGVYPLAFVLVIEMTGKRNREAGATVLNYFYAIGEAIVALIAWFSRDWVYVQLIVSTPALLFVGYYWIIPESVRWLLANRKEAEAKMVLMKVAKINKVPKSNSLKNYLERISVIKGLFYNPLPMIVFGGLAILAGILAMNLPETRGIKLPETVEEAINI